jgi:hypothetical protein
LSGTVAVNQRDKVNPVQDLFDAAAQHYAIKLTCRRCRHQRIFNPHALWHLFDKNGWPDWLRDVRKRCRCTECGARDPALDLVNEPETGEPLPMPSESEWKRMSRRRR